MNLVATKGRYGHEFSLGRPAASMRVPVDAAFSLHTDSDKLGWWKGMVAPEKDFPALFEWRRGVGVCLTAAGRAAVDAALAREAA